MGYTIEDAIRDVVDVVRLTREHEDALRAELAELRRKAKAMDDLNERVYYIRLVGGASIVSVDQGKTFRVIRHDGKWEGGRASLLEADEQAREVNNVHD